MNHPSGELAMLRPTKAALFLNFAAAVAANSGSALADERSPVDRPAVEAPAGPKKAEDEGFAPLHLAAMRGDVKEVDRLLVAGADVNTLHAEFKGAPLQYAAAEGHADVVKRLLAVKGVQVDAVDANGRTPLMWGAMNGKSEAVALLLDADANIGAGNDGGWTALHYAMSRNHERVAHILLERGASEELLNRQGKTAEDVKGTVVE